MDDLISRSLMLESIQTYQMDIVAKATAIRCINAQPTVNKWIPCSEELPKIGKEVFVTYRTKYRSDNTYVGSLCGPFWMVNGIKRKLEDVIAWMPCPEPYKPESEVADSE